MFVSAKILDRQLGVVAGDLQELQALEDTLAQLGRELEEAADKIDESDEDAAARAYIACLSRAGLLRYLTRATYGGIANEVRSTPICIIRQWLARTSGALDTAFIMQGLGSFPVTLAGSDALRAELLPKVCNGETICAFALTEPEAGSDVGNMQTTAEPNPNGDGVVLRGEKCWISNAGLADSYVVFAREHQDNRCDNPSDKPRFSAFWVPANAQGLRIKREKVIAPHPIGSVFFDGVCVPEAHRIGEAGQGLRIAFGTLEVFRVTVGAAALGLADRALEATVAHLNTRVQFGKPLAKQQGLRFAVAEVATEHMAAQLLVYRAAGARDEGRSTSDQPAMAKYYATETAQRVVDRAVQSLGGRGVAAGQVTERLYREVRALRIYEGTTEIQKLVIARALFDGK